MNNIAVVVPTIRMKESMPAFMEAWQPLFDKHNVELIVIDDTGDKPQVIHNGEPKEIQPHKFPFVNTPKSKVEIKPVSPK